MVVAVTCQGICNVVVCQFVNLLDGCLVVGENPKVSKIPAVYLFGSELQGLVNCKQFCIKDFHLFTQISTVFFSVSIIVSIKSCTDLSTFQYTSVGVDNEVF